MPPRSLCAISIDGHPEDLLAVLADQHHYRVLKYLNAEALPSAVVLRPQRCRAFLQSSAHPVPHLIDVVLHPSRVRSVNVAFFHELAVVVVNLRLLRRAPPPYFIEVINSQVDLTFPRLHMPNALRQHHLHQIINHSAQLITFDRQNITKLLVSIPFCIIFKVYDVLGQAEFFGLQLLVVVCVPHNVHLVAQIFYLLGLDVDLLNQIV